MEKTTVASGQVMTVSRRVELETTMIMRSLVRSSPIKVVVATSREDGEIRVVKNERWTDCDRVVKEVRVDMKQGDTVSVSWDNTSNWIGRDVLYSIVPSKSREERIVEYQEKLRRYGVEWMASNNIVKEWIKNETRPILVSRCVNSKGMERDRVQSARHGSRSLSKLAQQRSKN